MEYALALVLLCALAWFAAAPLRGGGTDDPATASGGEDPERAELEALKEATYRQIRDAELDRVQGKLSEADWARADAELRREAVAILKRIDALSRGR